MSDRTPRRFRFAVLIASWVVLAGVGWSVYRGVERRSAVDRICDAVAAGDHAAALAAGDGLVAADAPGRRAAECRALALMATDRYDEGVAVLEGVLGSGDWLPAPRLLLTVLAVRRGQGRLAAAADLARRATAAYPDDADLLYLELDARAEIEDEKAVLDDLESRLPGMGSAAPLMRIRFAQRRTDRGDLERAAELFGPEPPAAERALVDEWYRALAVMHAAAADPREVAATCRRWLETGAGGADVLAWHALTLSIYQLQDRDFPVLPMLEQAVSRRGELADPSVLQTLYVRLVRTLVAAGRHDEALTHFDTASREFDLGLTRGDILRSAGQRSLAELPAAERRALLRFVVDAPRPLGTLLVSPDADAPVDRDFERFALGPDGVLELERTVGTAPQRWVYRDRDERAVASGTVWPRRKGRLEVRIAPQPPAPRRPAHRVFSRRLPADGRRRVLVVILDGADWRLVQYLRARGDLPLIDALLAGGTRAVLESRPSFTAAALAALVSPARRRPLSPFGVLHQLGAELGSAPFAGRNPLAGLAWLLPESPSLFETLGAGERVTVNLLYSVGGLRGGRHGEMVGPRGALRTFHDWRARRPLDAAEKAFFTSARGTLHEAWVEEVAAAFDAAEAAADRDEVDLLLLRVASFDTATHGVFAVISETAQDDGDSALYDLYRYADDRLARLHRRLDGDDVLVVMSDHGIRTSTEHDPRCFFVAAGGGVPRGRVPGTPSLRGVPRLLAELLGVETDWPRTGIEAWAAEMR